MLSRRFALAVLTLVLPCLPSCASDDKGPERPATLPAPAGATAVDPLAWPRRFESGGKEYAIYQPQIDKWDANRLEARAAVTVTPAGGKGEPDYGTLSVTARTEVDKSDRMVTLDDLKLTAVSFPQAKAQEAAYLDAIRKHVPTKAREVPLDHLEANLAATTNAREAEAAVAVKNDPPRVIFATAPSILTLIDGEPSLQQVGGTTGGARLMRVVNTRALVLLDESTATYYLHLMNRWVSARSPLGPWAAAAAPPAGAEAIKTSLAQAGTVDLLDPESPDAAPKQLPVVFVSTTPAELIQTTGQPEYTLIAGTDLQYVTNTDSALFRQGRDGRFYALISGRWFTSASLERGPWAFVPGKSLPSDFARIPPDSPKANVLVSVPATPEAQEAVIANSIPQTATVKVAETQLNVAYDGQPKWKPIDGADGLSYAVNTTSAVIRVEADQTCWCVKDGVWFTAAAPTGPWAVATAVPGVIYTIPLSSPLHYVTYVRVYGTGPGVVYCGYTPGYMGTVTSTDGVVVYGTGYYYPAYVGTTWVGYPPTYGYGAGFACGSATGFAFGFAAGAAVGGCWGSPYWGPYHGGYYGYRYANVDINSSNVYRNARGGTTTVNRRIDWETGEGGVAKRSAKTFNPYTGRASAAGGKIQMDDDGDYTVKRGGATYDPRTGTVRAGGVKTTGDLEDGDYHRKSGQAVYNTRTDTGVARKGGDYYVAKDGEVYKHDNDGGGWQHKTNNGWESASANSARAAQTQDLDRQRQARSTGQQRYESSRSTGGSYSSRGSSSYSGSRGGGYGGSRGGSFGGSRGGGGRGGGRR